MHTNKTRPPLNLYISLENRIFLLDRWETFQIIPDSLHLLKSSSYIGYSIKVNIYSKIQNQHIFPEPTLVPTNSRQLPSLPCLTSHQARKSPPSRMPKEKKHRPAAAALPRRPSRFESTDLLLLHLMGGYTSISDGWWGVRFGYAWDSVSVCAINLSDSPQ